MTLALQVDCLKKTYEAEGDFFALLGPNGAGKSTIIVLFHRLQKKLVEKFLFLAKILIRIFLLLSHI